MPKKPEDKPAEQHPTDAIEARRTGADTPDDSMTDAEEAKRSGPPPTGDAMPKPLADPDPEPKPRAPDSPVPDGPTEHGHYAAQPSAAHGAWSGDVSRLVEEMLADPEFDHDGKYRQQLGRLAASMPKR